jgi:hypothetical protein
LYAMLIGYSMIVYAYIPLPYRFPPSLMFRINSKASNKLVEALSILPGDLVRRERLTILRYISKSNIVKMGFNNLCQDSIPVER